MPSPAAIAHPNLRISFSSFSPPADSSHESSSLLSSLKPTTKLQFHVHNSANFPSIKFKCHHCRIRNSSAVLRYLVPDNEGNGDENFKSFEKWVRDLRSLVPGGRWWNLDEHKEVKIEYAKPVAVYITLCRIWKLVWDSNRWVLLVAFGSLTIAAISEISMPSILAASVFSASSGKTAEFARNFQLLVILTLTSGICSGLRSGCFGVANVILVKHLREILYSAIIFQDIFFFDKETVGNLTSRLGADCQQLSHVIGNDINLITRNALQGTGALVNLLTLSWPLAISTLVICSVLSIVFLLYSRYLIKTAKLNQEYTACANEVASESLSLVKTIRIYGTEKKEVGRYKQWLDMLAFVNTRESAGFGLWSMSFTTMYKSTQVFAVLLGGMSILSGQTSVEQLTKYVLYCEWLIYATRRITDNLSSLLYSIAASETVFKIIDLLPSEQFLSKGVKLQGLMGHIQFVNVSFHYHSRDVLLEHINVTIRANEVVAIVGPSGCGKSTLVKLLLRLYEPSKGQIFVDGFPLRELDIRWLREKIGFVEQEPELFHMDIRSNIRYGCVMDTTQEDIESAARQAFAHEFISSLPNGYDTIVDDNLLSGGQKQRIAIARAILRDPSILILDEATSALDSESEHYVKGAIYALKKKPGQKTVIVIAHRLSTVKSADKIIVMDRGQVVEIGNHEELLLKDGYYAQLIKVHSDVFS